MDDDDDGSLGTHFERFFFVFETRFLEKRRKKKEGNNSKNTPDGPPTLIFNVRFLLLLRLPRRQTFPPRINSNHQRIRPCSE
jgi:hypothetical protein